jgi:peptidyl-prolyl cis-trans isomerase C
MQTTVSKISVRLTRVCALAVLCTWVASTAFGAETRADDPVVAQNSSVKITRAEFEAELQRIPPEMRSEFIASNKRVGDLLLQMLLRKTLANQAKREKLDADPVNAARVSNEADRVLAQLRVAQVDEAAGAEFDAKRASQVARARELYLADRDRYRVPEEISASHILFDTKKHSSEDARKLAADARARVVAGADFNVVAKEVSEDPSAEQNSGRLGWFTRERMDAAFSRAAFALKQAGDVSEPVQSAFGWHVIRLDDRRAPRVRPFEEVQDEILASLKKTYVEQKREALLGPIRSDPQNAINDAEVKSLVEHTMAPTEHTHGPDTAPASAAKSAK